MREIPRSRLAEHNHICGRCRDIFTCSKQVNDPEYGDCNACTKQYKSLCDPCYWKLVDQSKRKVQA